MSSWSDFSYAYGPLMAIGGMAVLIVLLRWAFSRGSSVVAQPARNGTSDQYGLLISVSIPNTYIEGEIQRQALEAAGVRATLATTSDGPRLMVWPDDADRARVLLSQ